MFTEYSRYKTILVEPEFKSTCSLELNFHFSFTMKYLGPRILDVGKGKLEKLLGKIRP
jgi:hypothetical protein